MAAETDQFIIATFALWAGDFSYVQQLLERYSPPHDTPRIADSASKPEDIIRATGALRLRQLWQKRGEFKKLVEQDTDVQLTDEPIILETKHIRATLWRSAEREFFLQGYLKDLSWQGKLFELAHRQALNKDSPKVPVFDAVTDLFEREDEQLAFVTFMPTGCSWVIAGNPFIQVELTDLGLLEAAGLWTEARLPRDAQAINNAFSKLLQSLDESLSDSSK